MIRLTYNNVENIIIDKNNLLNDIGDRYLILILLGGVN